MTQLVGVITRTIKKIQDEVGSSVGTFRNRMRSVSRRVIEIARTARSRTAQGQNRVSSTSASVGSNAGSDGVWDAKVGSAW